MRFALRLLPFLSFVLTALNISVANAQFGGDERITSFQSKIQINTDGSLDVTETISVIAQNQNINRGIFRDFPTDYRDRNGNRYRVSFDIVEVLRNGQIEPYRIENQGNGKRVYIGQSDVIIDRGPHTYTITYKTDRQLGFFQDFDELYWNVTGNGWAFRIEKARVEINLPIGARLLEFDGYTGPQGAQGRDWRAAGIVTNPITFETTRALSPNEGFTIVVSWPKGIVTEPTELEKAQALLNDNKSLGLGLAGLLGVFGYYAAMWNRHGRDPEGGTIFPRLKPPAGVSPGAARFVWKMGYDRKSYTAAVVNLAVKGAITIEENGGTFILRKTENDVGSTLGPGEKVIYKKLLGSRSSITLDNAKHATFQSSISSFREKLSNEFEFNHFVRNSKLFYIGAGLSAAVVLLSAFFTSGPGLPIVLFMSLWLSIWTIGVLALFQKVKTAWADVFNRGRSKFFSVPSAIGITLFATPFFLGELFGIGIVIGATSIEYALILVLLGTLNTVFFNLLKAPTRAGRDLMDEIEGFRQYLSVAEQDRLDQLMTPKKTPELFEKFLPYAIALDVENEWGQQFAGVLDAASNAENGRGGHYQPRWYSGSSWNRVGSSGFGSALGSSLGSSIASSATAPGSSSGGGGGGSSGGGGGGGGGGGW